MAHKIKLRRIPRKYLHQMIVEQQKTLNDMAEVLHDHEVSLNKATVHFKRFLKALNPWRKVKR